MESKLQADPLRHNNKSLFLRNQDHLLNFKQMSLIRSHAPTVGGVISARRVDVYKKRKKEHIRNTKISKTAFNIASYAWFERPFHWLWQCARDWQGNFRVEKPGTKRIRIAKTTFNFILNLTLAFWLAHKHFYCFYYNFVFF